MNMTEIGTNTCGMQDLLIMAIRPWVWNTFNRNQCWFRKKSQ